ncbi:MAG: type II secretion system protein [Candidatus Aminicenantes bacterium]|nr:type II secretion system protein [Candidatus Aminicenantes bacterium]
MVTGRSGATLLILMVFISVLTVGLLVALPVWHTQAQRELEEELIFRGRQVVEAVRVYQKKNPGAFPRNLEELVKQRCLRKRYPDPMTKDGRWNLILEIGAAVGPSPSRTVRAPARPGQTPPGRSGTARLFIVPEAGLSAVQNPRIIGVASASPKPSFRVHEDGETYDAWLFYYGRDPGQKPEIIRFGQPAKHP